MYIKPRNRLLIARLSLTGVLLALALAFVACGDDGDDGKASNDDAGGEPASQSAAFNFADPEALTVGISLQFKPQAYLDENGEAAGYDVDVLKKLADDLGVKLQLENLDFTGLIPGLQAKKFDMVSSGLSPTPERKKVIDFSQPYIPFALVLGVQPKDGDITSPDALNESGKTITALQNSTGEQLAKKLFPEATVTSFQDQTAAFLQVATGRADGVVVEYDLLGQFQASNPNKLVQANIPEPLEVQYGSWAVQKGNTAFVEYLDKWLCDAREDGSLGEIYKRNFKVKEFPPMPAC